MSTATITDKKQIAELETYLRSGDRSYWQGIIFDNNGKLSLHKIAGAPCLGELRPYHEDGDTVSRPSDLRHPWPKTGHPVAVGIRLSWWHTKDQEFIDTWWGEDGPWGKAFSNKHVKYLRDERESLIGLIVTNTKVNPDIMVNGFGVSRSESYIYPIYKKLREGGATPKEALRLAISNVRQSGPNLQAQINGVSGWVVAPDFKRTLNADPKTFTAKTFYDRGAYHRPKIEHIWADQKTLAKAYPDLGIARTPKDFVEAFHATVSY